MAMLRTFVFLTGCCALEVILVFTSVIIGGMIDDQETRKEISQRSCEF